MRDWLTFSLIAENPSLTSATATLTTSAGDWFESTSAQIWISDDLSYLLFSFVEGWSISNKLEPFESAMALRIAISKPHLTLGKTEDGCMTDNNNVKNIFVMFLRFWYVIIKETVLLS